MLKWAGRAVLATAVAGLVGAWSAGPAFAARDGSLDASFGVDGFSLASYGTWAAAAAVVVQPDGRIVTAGETMTDGVYEIIATRTTSGGQLDPSFGNGGIVTVRIGGAAFVDSGAGLALQSDGKIVIAGTGTVPGPGGVGGRLEFVAVRLAHDGSLDSGFGRGGIAAVPIGQHAIANAVVIDPLRRISLGGTAEVNGVNHFAVARLNGNGSLDTSFGTNGSTVLPPFAAAWGMVLDRTGGLVLAGQQLYNGTNVYMAARVRPDGAPDSGFGHAGVVTLPIGSTAIAYAIATAAGGKLVISGNATDSAGKWVVPTVQLNADGTLDGSFGKGGIAQWPGQGVNAMTVDSWGRILLAGCGAAVVRLNPDGSTDATFGQGGSAVYTYGSNSAANGIAIQPGGALVLAGAAYFSGALHVLAFRLDAGGSGGVRHRSHRRALRSLTVARHKEGPVRARYVLRQSAALVRANLFELYGKKARRLIGTVTNRNVPGGRHTMVLRLAPAYWRAPKHGRRRRMLLRLAVVTADGTESASRVA